MSALGTNQTHLQDYNRRIVLHAVRLHGPLSRADLARITGLSHPAVSTIVAGLQDQGLVREAGTRSTKRGRFPLDIEINPDGAFGIGINLNRDSLIGTLVNLEGVEQARVQTDVSTPGPQEAVPMMREVIDTFAGQTPKDRLLGVGVAFPGPIQRQSGSVAPINYEGWEGVRFSDLLGNSRLPVYLENNATAAAIGEQWYGIGRVIRTFYYVFFGVGIGGGAMLDGRPYVGSTGNAASLGRTLVPGQNGEARLLESLASLSTIYATLGSQGISASTPSDLAQLFADGCEPLSLILDSVADAFSFPLHNVQMQFDPEAIVFGGRLSKELLVELVERIQVRLEHTAPHSATRFARLAVGEAGEEAAALGAATLPLYDALAPNHDLVFDRGREKSPAGGTT